MNKNMIKLGGVTAVLGGLHLLLLAGFQAFEMGDIEDYPLLEQTIMLMPIMLTIGALGLFLLANGRRGLQLGAVVMVIGGLLLTAGFGSMVWFENDMGWPLMMFGMLILPIGFLIFGLFNWHAKVLSRWNRLPLTFGILTNALIISTLFELWREQQNVNELVFAIYLFLLGTGWILIGVPILLNGQETTVSPPMNDPQFS